ncbi:MAG: PLP-dependent transferase, partial [Saprospiraceae bacterium]|nr:PLP-dependent transferase [Saprospiraceae bacterium]
LVYFETPANPTMHCIDIAQLCRISAAQGVLTCVDNTFCTPILQRPLSLGADFVIHSTTKYLNGHGNSIAGAIIGKDEKWKQQVWTTLKLSGAICSPWEAWLVYNGIKTLHLRMERHSSNGLSLARWLQSHHKVSHVNYCGLENNVSFSIASKQMSDFGGMLSFAIDSDLNRTLKFIDALQFCTHAPTLGDVDTLVLHPATSSHLNVDRDVRISQGITDNLIRVSVGIENIEDIIEDFSQAFKNID